MKLTEKEKRVIIALCRNDLNASNAAKDVFYHHNTVIYQAQKIKEKTGHDPRTFFGALRLLTMINEGK